MVDMRNLEDDEKQKEDRTVRKLFCEKEDGSSSKSNEYESRKENMRYTKEMTLHRRSQSMEAFLPVEHTVFRAAGIFASPAKSGHLSEHVCAYACAFHTLKFWYNFPCSYCEAALLPGEIQSFVPNKGKTRDRKDELLVLPFPPMAL